jgi:hypothetical protein
MIGLLMALQKVHLGQLKVSAEKGDAERRVPPNGKHKTAEHLNVPA